MKVVLDRISLALFGAFLKKVMNKKQLGYKYEKIARNFLIQNWFTILDTNFTIRWGEIDIIAKKNNIVSFIEVKWVSGYTDFQDYITVSKLKALEKTANHWMYEYDDESILEYRFDLIFIENDKIVDFIEWFTS